MKQTSNIPKDKGLDNTINLLKEGYLFIPNRMNLYHTDIFETRILGQKSICITGKDAPRLFYNTTLFQRKGATPKRVQKTLFGENAIQSKDNMAHIKRKYLFMDILSQKEEEKLAKLVKEELKRITSQWESMGEVVLFREISKVICFVVCNWVGITVTNIEVNHISKDFIKMIYSFGSVGSKYSKGKKARKEMEKWIKGIVEDVRNNRLIVDSNTPLYKISYYKDVDSKLLDSKMAAVEIINIIRPIIAISIYIVFAAVALYNYPECKEKLMNNKNKYSEMFTQEVRRFYPLTPYIGARVKQDFMWDGYKIKKGKLVLLDVYGINHDPRIWENPYEFRPERFENETIDLFKFIPQGGGNPSITHRCPGEGVTVRIIEVVLDFLINDIYFDVYEQDLNYSLSKIPTLPKSGFVISNIRRR